ncbi:MAG: lytic transglycosylase domain-containing protein [Candidatus Bathyarchaeota archaeon]|nr:lytic transglycosylase domain-containing protein [Candidatus Bathyarchaeota archaeon]
MERKTVLYLSIGAMFAGALGYIGYKTGILNFPFSYRVLTNFKDYINAASQKYGVDPAIISAVIYQESGGNPNAISSAGAIGLMQIMPATGASECGFTQPQLFNVQNNIECGTRYLKKIYDQYGDIQWAIAGYYGGPGTPPTSTKGTPPVYKYVSDVIRHYGNIKSAMV